MISRLFVSRKGKRTSEESLKTIFRYSDVIVGLFTLGLAVAALVIVTNKTTSWDPKDSLGFGISLIALGTFCLSRQSISQQRSSWLYSSIAALMFVGMALLFRRWTIPWIFVSSTLLMLSLVIRTKPISEPISPLDLLPVFVILASVLFTIMLVEITLRLAPGILPEGARLRVHWQEGSQRWYTPHPYIGHLHAPDAHASRKTARPGLELTAEHDPWGFRNHWPWPGQVDILAIGDSFTYSQMVDEDQAWTTMLARWIPPSRVLNLGLIGAAPQQYLRIYETFGIDLAPKVVLIGLFLQNDLWGAGEFDRWWKAGGKQAFPEFGSHRPASGLRGWVVRKLKGLYLTVLLQDVRESYRAGRLFSGKTIELSSEARIQLVPNLLTQMAAYAQPQRLQFTLVLETIEHINALAQKNHTECLILFFPSKEEVYLPILGEKVADLSSSFISELERRGISYLDLGPFFRQRAAVGEQLFFEVDGHPNARGYALIAEVVLAHLEGDARKYGLRDQKSAPLK